MTTISEVFWHAACECGWRSEVPNDADTVCNKIGTHLKLEHDKVPANLTITSYVEVRPITQLPALGLLPTQPTGVAVIPHPSG